MRDDEATESLEGNRLVEPAKPGAPADGTAPSGHGEHPSAVRRKPLYSEYFGLREPAFDLTPNPRFLFLTPRQREALSNLRYGLTTYKGFTMLVGEAGTGKTTLIRAVLGSLSDTPSRYVLLSNPTLSRDEFYELLAREFNLSDEARTSKTQFLSELQLEIESRYILGGLTGIIVDEAQSLPDELLEEIRLLGNIETATSKLLNIVLSGQPELADRLNQPSLRQLKQRLALRCELRTLTLEETAAYISGRIRIAGGNPQGIFSRQAVIAIHEASAGIPRTVNVLCDNALISGFAAHVKPITLDIVREVCRDFDVGEADEASGTLAAHPSASPARPPAPPPPPVVQVSDVQPNERPMFRDVSAPRKRKFIFFALLLSALSAGPLRAMAAPVPFGDTRTGVALELPISTAAATSKG